MIVADILLQPGSIAAWLGVGLIFGWLDGKLMGDASYGVVGNLVLGAAGGLVGGALFGCLVEGEPAFWGAVVAASVGACILLFVGRAIAAARSA